MPPADVAETYFRNSLDLKCEEACYKANVEMLAKGFNPSREAAANDSRESCMSDCFIPGRGDTDSQLCLEKCNVNFDQDLQAIVESARSAIKEHFTERIKEQ